MAPRTHLTHHSQVYLVNRVDVRLGQQALEEQIEHFKIFFLRQLAAVYNEPAERHSPRVLAIVRGQARKLPAEQVRQHNVSNLELSGKV